MWFVPFFPPEYHCMYSEGEGLILIAWRMEENGEPLIKRMAMCNAKIKD